MAEEKLVRFWRGTRESYQALADNGLTDYWTRYSVHEDSGEWTEYYGTNLISAKPGQLLPVKKIVEESKLPQEPMELGDRYLVKASHPAPGSTGYYILEVRFIPTSNGKGIADSVLKELEEGVSVRVASERYMNYLIVEGELITYDSVDCGEY